MHVDVRVDVPIGENVPDADRVGQFHRRVIGDSPVADILTLRAVKDIAGRSRPGRALDRPAITSASCLGALERGESFGELRRLTAEQRPRRRVHEHHDVASGCTCVAIIVDGGEGDEAATRMNQDRGADREGVRLHQSVTGRDVLHVSVIAVVAGRDADGRNVSDRRIQHAAQDQFVEIAVAGIRFTFEAIDRLVGLDQDRAAGRVDAE